MESKNYEAVHTSVLLTNQTRVKPLQEYATFKAALCQTLLELRPR